MNKICKAILFLAFFTAFLYGQAQTSAESRSIEGYAIINVNTPSITLHWSGTSNATGYKIYRRALGSSSWGNPIKTLTTTELEYIDESVTTETVYEYAIQKTTNTADPLAGGTMQGYSYISASIQKPANHANGSMLLLITKLINDSLSSEITGLVDDLSNDGWAVSTEVITPELTITQVKAIIKAKKEAGQCDAVYLLGNIPVPYSGTFCTDVSYQYPPDGHTAAAPPSHCGAWPSDGYYGSFDGNWTDLGTDSTGARAENKNIPGDGKFDNIRLPGIITVAIGRVDFSKLSAFTESEVQLTKRYLAKVHAFKMGETVTQNKGIVEDNFSGYAEGFSSSAIRNITAVCGPNSILRGDIFANSDTADFLFSYTCGAGYYNSCSGVGNSTNYKTQNGAAFNFIFGSYFGDFDINNNFMRASMASTKLGFGCVWSGRPKWVWHTMALGDNYAGIAIRSQNNWQDYDGNYYQNGVHMNLLGDPSLRTHFISPPTNLSLSIQDSDQKVKSSWTASSDMNVLGYYIYRSAEEFGSYTLASNNIISGTTYVDESPLNGKSYYMVRAARETETGSGSYINLSLGTKNSVQRTAKIAAVDNQALKLYPTLTNATLTLENQSNKTTSYSIINAIGTEMQRGKIAGIKTTIDVTQLESGVYYLLQDGTTQRFVKY